MKHVKTYGIFGFFKKEEGDDYAKKVLDVVEKENLDIFKMNSAKLNGDLCVGIDDVIISFEYFEDNDNNPDCRILIIEGTELPKQLKISYSIYKKAEKLFKEKQRKMKEIMIKNLPDITELGRAAKKYNL